MNYKIVVVKSIRPRLYLKEFSVCVKHAKKEFNRVIQSGMQKKEAEELSKNLNELLRMIKVEEFQSKKKVYTCKPIKFRKIEDKLKKIK